MSNKQLTPMMSNGNLMLNLNNSRNIGNIQVNNYSMNQTQDGIHNIHYKEE